MSAAIQFGYHLPIWGPAATRETLIAAARRVESLGFDSVWASDHIAIPFEIRSRYPYNATGDFPLPPSANFLEPLTAMASSPASPSACASAPPCSCCPIAIPCSRRRSWPPSITWHPAA